jgi:hypothetical protein
VVCRSVVLRRVFVLARVAAISSARPPVLHALLGGKILTSAVSRALETPLNLLNVVLLSSAMTNLGRSRRYCSLERLTKAQGLPIYPVDRVAVLVGDVEILAN